MVGGIYQTCFELIERYVYGSVIVGSYQELVCILFSTCACLFVAALPFVLVFRVIRMLAG